MARKPAIAWMHVKPHIHWKIQRLDDGDEPDLRYAECLLEIEGRIECGGQTAGLVDAFYLHDDEVRDLPWNSPEEDRATLMRHFETWGMKYLPNTRFMMAAPESLRDSRAPQWPPCPILDQWNTCIACSGWIDRDGGGWLESEEGPIHRDCM